MEELLKSGKFITLQTLLRRHKSRIVEGVESRRGGNIQALTVSREERAVKKTDVWVIRDTKRASVTAENRHTNRVITIPMQVLRPALRRVPLVNRLDVSKELDYIVIGSFPDVKEFVNGLHELKVSGNLWNRWKPLLPLIIAHFRSFSFHWNSRLPLISAQPESLQNRTCG
jgi:hypothetical protein